MNPIQCVRIDDSGMLARIEDALAVNYSGVQDLQILVNARRSGLLIEETWT
jgi:hypothetical protein